MDKLGLKRKAPQEASWFEMDDQHNTKVYVSNLPLDITEQEFLDVMQKCGMVMKDLETGKMKIKLYSESGTNQLKGDAHSLLENHRIEKEGKLLKHTRTMNFEIPDEPSLITKLFKNTTDDSLENDSFKRTPDGSLDNYWQKKKLAVVKTADDGGDGR
ncbi:hypothetical protein L9F63_001702 [Diploptera punctata]|uniref:RRM domain-containing protein n=1 Tax=Diploptera punctata TaxID=6984 RepID=A0AAD8A4E1_DIPPU|nr:hypothetical protein L9F63_001702 [Diploptera punctata]